MSDSLIKELMEELCSKKESLDYWRDTADAVLAHNRHLESLNDMLLEQLSAAKAVVVQAAQLETLIQHAAQLHHTLPLGLISSKRQELRNTLDNAQAAFGE